MKHICSYYIWFVIFFGAAPLFILYLVRLIFWCSTSVHTIFGSSYFWVQHMCSYYIWFVIFWNVLHLRVLLLDLRVLALFVLLWRVILWYVILLRVLLLHWRVIPVVHGTHGASYISVLNLGMPTSMVLFKWDGSNNCNAWLIIVMQGGQIEARSWLPCNWPHLGQGRSWKGEDSDHILLVFITTFDDKDDDKD